MTSAQGRVLGGRLAPLLWARVVPMGPGRARAPSILPLVLGGLRSLPRSGLRGLFLGGPWGRLRLAAGNMSAKTRAGSAGHVCKDQGGVRGWGLPGTPGPLLTLVGLLAHCLAEVLGLVLLLLLFLRLPGPLGLGGCPGVLCIAVPDALGPLQAGQALLPGSEGTSMSWGGWRRSG